jgi:hypothetical protein
MVIKVEDEPELVDDPVPELADDPVLPVEPEPVLDEPVEPEPALDEPVEPEPVLDEPVEPEPALADDPAPTIPSRWSRSRRQLWIPKWSSPSLRRSRRPSRLPLSRFQRSRPAGWCSPEPWCQR